MKETVRIIVDGEEIIAERGKWLLQVLLNEGFEVPHLCFHEAVSPYGACRLCIVEVSRHGRSRVATSCNYPVMDGMEIKTSSEKVVRLRKITMEMIVAMAPASKEIRKYAENLGVKETRFDVVNPDGDCILCGLCERVCSEIVGANAISFNKRGGEKRMSPPFVESTQECIACGGCVFVCPSRCIKLIQTKTTRIIDRWGRIAAMTRSEISGVPFAPTPQLEYFAKIAGIPIDFYKLAPGERKVEHK